MEDRRQGRQTSKRYSTDTERDSYIYGNVAEQPDVRRRLDEEPKIDRRANRKIREKTIQMNLPYVIFLAGALCIAGIILVDYIKLQSDITMGNEEAARLESEYLDLKVSNDETYTRIMNSVDLAKIEQIAREELGMHYATEGQVVVYSNEMQDYVKQFVDIE